MPINIDDTTIIKSLYGAVTTLLVFIGGLLNHIYRKSNKENSENHAEIRQELKEAEERLAAACAKNAEDIDGLRAANSRSHSGLHERIDELQKTKADK